MQANGRLAAGQFDDLAMPPGHGHDHAHTNRLAKRFFGRKACGHIANAALGPALAAGLPGRQLTIGQNLFGKALAMLFQTLANAAHVADVRTYAVDHALLLMSQKWLKRLFFKRWQLWFQDYLAAIPALMQA